ncbi:hypothetical protein ACIBCD_42095 [Nocardia brasiliensis]|uniref:hypothetical protein n=1 Tax=Nocardia brasiliensis TaxID=37326 RepID=UPI0037B65577
MFRRPARPRATQRNTAWATTAFTISGYTAAAEFGVLITVEIRYDRMDEFARHAAADPTGKLVLIL